MASWRTAKLRVAGVAALAVPALVLAACGSAGNSSSTSSAASPATSSSTSSATSTAAAAATGMTIGTAKAHGKTYLTGASGRSVYLWLADTGGKSSCSGACAKVWPPVTTTGKPAAGPGVSAADLGTIKRSDGSEQVTYSGHPLYYYVGDAAPGSTKGEGLNGFGAKWWLVAPSGNSITTGSSPSSSSSGGAYGGSSGSGSSSTWG